MVNHVLKLQLQLKLFSHTISTLNRTDSIVNKPEVREKEQLCAELLFAEIMKYYMRRTVNKKEKKNKLLKKIVICQKYPGTYFSRQLCNRVIFLVLGAYVVKGTTEREKLPINSALCKPIAGEVVTASHGSRQQSFVVVSIGNRSPSLSMTHMNQVVIGGVLWCVQGLRLLGPAGGPRQPLVSWKKEQIRLKLVYFFQDER